MERTSERKNSGDECIRLKLEAARKRKEEASREKTAKRHANHNAKRRPATSKNDCTGSLKTGSTPQKGSRKRAISPPKTSRPKRSSKQGVAGQGMAEKKDTALTSEINESVIRQRLSKKKTAEVDDKKNRDRNKNTKAYAKRRVPKPAKKQKKDVVNQPKSTPARGQTPSTTHRTDGLCPHRTYGCYGCMNQRDPDKYFIRVDDHPIKGTYWVSKADIFSMVGDQTPTKEDQRCPYLRSRRKELKRPGIFATFEAAQSADRYGYNETWHTNRDCKYNCKCKCCSEELSKGIRHWGQT